LRNAIASIRTGDVAHVLQMRGYVRVLDLFSGIGGFSLGLERAGMETVAFCEIDPYCRMVLAKHWPGVPIYEDIKQLDGSQYVGAVDVICGGYPCQPFSDAGKKQGEADTRHLWPEMRRIIREARPRWVVAENVRGHVRLGFDTVVAQLEDEGFIIWPFIIPACAVGAPHRRDRLWIVAYAERVGWGGQPYSPQWNNPDGQTAGRQKGSDWAEYCCQDVPDTPCSGLEEQRLPAEKRSLVADATRRGRGSYNASIEGHWAVEPDVGRVANGIPYRVDRLRALGNAVVPRIPELIGRAILAYEQRLMEAA
jgi:DNA (cytosine-5)-methyltransferase 1